MRTHELKCWPREYRAVCCGDKTFEYRKNDRDFQAGDDLVLREWDPHTESYTGFRCYAHVPFVLRGPAFGVPDGYAVMSLTDVAPEDES